MVNKFLVELDLQLFADEDNEDGLIDFEDDLEDEGNDDIDDADDKVNPDDVSNDDFDESMFES